MTKQLKVIRLVNANGMALQLCNYGATIMDLQVPDREGNLVPVVVGLEKASDYYNSPHPCLGSSIGRYAGRIAGGQFTLQGKTYPIYHENGVHLHGGKRGFDSRFWEVRSLNQDTNPSVSLGLHSPHMEEGYPGNLEVMVTYQLTEDNALHITYQAQTDQPSPVNLTNHAYYNLEGTGSITGHHLMIKAAHYLEVSEQLLPSGKLLPTQNSRFDRAKLTQIGRPDFTGYDDTFVLQEGDLKAVLISPKTGIRMAVFTNQPATVVYTPPQLPELPYKEGRSYGPFSAICFETQQFPDAPNQAHFPQAILRPGETYCNASVFDFGLVDE